MPNYQGVVAKLMPEDKAEIMIAPGKQSIPGAPEVSKKVCHECTDGSTLRIEAVNRAGAEVGDWVTVTRPSGIVKKNTTALLGMPLSGIIIGGAVGGIMMFGMGLPVAVLVLCVIIGLVFGMMVGGKHYRALSEQNQLVINHIVKRKSELADMRAYHEAGTKKGDGASDLCSGCVVR